MKFRKLFTAFALVCAGVSPAQTVSAPLTLDHEGMSGIAIACAVEGIRPFLIEVQALVSTAAYGMPQRSATGFDLRRMNMLLAVLEKRVGFKLAQKDVFLNIAVLELKEAEYKMKAESEKQANARMSKVQSAEAKAKQRELQLNQMQSELQRKRNETDALKNTLDNQMAAIEIRQNEVDKMHKKAQEMLEHISGLSAEEAKEKLVESLFIKPTL